MALRSELVVSGPPRWLSEPRRPRVIRDHPKAYWFAVGAVCVGAFMGQLDASIVTLAFPTLEHHFHSSLGGVTWVGLSYLVTLVAAVTALGRFADMAGRKLLYLYGFLVFIMGSLLCGLAPNLFALDGFRVLQGIGAAMLQANSVAIIALAVPRRALGRAVGIQGAAQALGLALGPTVGGLLLSSGGWRSIFFVNVPFGLLGVLAGWLFIPRSQHLAARVRFDWPGLALFVPAVLALLFAISFGDAKGWTSTLIVGSLLAVALLATTFVWREARTKAPLLDLSLFRRTGFTSGITSGLLSYLVMFGVLFVVPFFLERGERLGTARTGAELLVMPLFLGVVAPIAGKLADRFGARSLTTAGMALTAAALCGLSLFHESPTVFLCELGLVGVGLGLFTSPNNAAIMGSVPSDQTGVASGVLNMTRGLGTAMGLAFAGLVFAISNGHSLGPLASEHGFAMTTLFLAAVAGLATVLSALRSRGPLNCNPLALAE